MGGAEPQRAVDPPLGDDCVLVEEPTARGGEASPEATGASRSRGTFRGDTPAVPADFRPRARLRQPPCRWLCRPVEPDRQVSSPYEGRRMDGTRRANATPDGRCNAIR